MVGVQAYRNVHALTQEVFHPGLHFILPARIQIGNSRFVVKRVLGGGGGVAQESLLSSPVWRTGLTLKHFSAIRLIFPSILGRLPCMMAENFH